MPTVMAKELHFGDPPSPVSQLGTNMLVEPANTYVPSLYRIADTTLASTINVKVLFCNKRKTTQPNFSDGPMKGFYSAGGVLLSALTKQQ